MSFPHPEPDPNSPWRSHSDPPTFHTSGWSAFGDPAHDPLVPPPAGGLSALWERFNATLRRSGGALAAIMLVTFALPQLAWAVMLEVAFDGLVVTGGVVLPSAESFGAFTGGLLVALLVSVVLLSLLMALGWSAGIWAVTQAAVGQPVTVVAALSAGGRRLWSMFGWYMLYLLMVAVGLMMCVLPGLYLAVAGSLFSFVVMYERGSNPMSRSFRLLHQSFGQVVGRVALILLFMVVSSCVITAGTAIFGIDESARTAGARLTGNLVEALAMVVIYLVMLVALLLTYTQARARQEPLSTEQLWAATPQPPAGPADPIGGAYSPVNPG